MKNAKLFCSLILCYSGLLDRAAEQQEPTLERILQQSTIAETLLPRLSARELGSLSPVSHAMHEAVEPAIAAAMEKKILNARWLDLNRLRWKYQGNQAFKDYVVQSIKDFADTKSRNMD